MAIYKRGDTYHIDFTVGGFYSDQQSVYFTRQDIRYIAPGLNFQFTGNDPVNASSKAAFATVIAHPSDNLNVTAGLRYTNEEKKQDGFVTLNGVAADFETVRAFVPCVETGLADLREQEIGRAHV